MKNKNFVIVFVIMLLIFLFSNIPVFALTYSMHCYDWQGGYCDGKANGKTYSLNAGNVRLDSYAKITWVPSNSKTTTEKYTIALMKDNWWGKSNQGTRTQTASINGTKNVATWSISSSGTYYFYYENLLYK
ncbi:hypothetical protein [Thermoanaerobacterium butyriciformans]|uniref:Uncharacterized protein n=1 Tax=Thermoanaerobacterium butyriciformans TaxID=1702242 RepID=A0ABS4NEV0_9THEO|nr:hypothetical protein [Thermoanaerobacterium butyriciformans]MBP2071572.1 hypothetical protein [Thermoanaerobacterium butyriciformans]